MHIDWGVAVSVAQLALQFLLIPIVTKIWAMDVRVAKLETKLEA